MYVKERNSLFNIGGEIKLVSLGFEEKISYILLIINLLKMYWTNEDLERIPRQCRKRELEKMVSIYKIREAERKIAFKKSVDEWLAEIKFYKKSED